MRQAIANVRSADGTNYGVTIERAPRVKWWVSTPQRLWNTVTRNKSWWLTVHNERYAWPVLRESFQSEHQAEARLLELEREIGSGAVRLEFPAWRRRRR
jgi:hypothetical protein